MALPCLDLRLPAPELRKELPSTLSPPACGNPLQRPWEVASVLGWALCLRAASRLLRLTPMCHLSKRC